MSSLRLSGPKNFFFAASLTWDDKNRPDEKKPDPDPILVGNHALGRHRLVAQGFEGTLVRGVYFLFCPPPPGEGAKIWIIGWLGK